MIPAAPGPSQIEPRPVAVIWSRENRALWAMSEATRVEMQANAEADSGGRPVPGTDPGFLWDFWYPAARSVEIRGRSLTKAMLLEVPLVLGRSNDGRAFALR